uniref:Uncharacterized protein n=1 Tax=Lactuca sativa TaxID=4236 RepID=A0A9R1XC43_LACSA|nr:hypothetical protein LSAT_V11C500283830 [Lactuca sativa]
MNAKRRRCVNVPTANARIHGEVTNVATSSGWGFAWAVVLGVAVIGVLGYTFYKYRVRRYMDSEIRAIMAQYMPLGNEGEIPVHGSHGDI